MKLYIFDFCPYCNKALFMKEFSKLPIDVSVILEDDQHIRSTIMGNHKLPILQKDDGDLLPESNDIVVFLNTYQSSDGVLLNQRNKVQASINLRSAIFTPALLGLSKLNLKSLSTASARQAFIDRHEKHLGESLEDAYDHYIQSAKDAVQDFIKNFDRKGIFYDGDQPSFNDIELLPTLNLLSAIPEISIPTPFQDYLYDIKQKITFPLISDYSKMQ